MLYICAIMLQEFLEELFLTSVLSMLSVIDSDQGDCH